MFLEAPRLFHRELLFANGGSYIQAPPPQPHHLGSFYMGAALGYEFVGTDNKTNFGFSSDNLHGINGRILAGYGWQFQNNFTLALEAFGGYSDANRTIWDTKFRKTYSFGASILPGYMITRNTDLFMRLGYINSNFKASAFGSSANTHENGGQVGLGLQTRVSQHVSIRGEYDWTRYQDWGSASNFRLAAIYHFGA